MRQGIPGKVLILTALTAFAAIVAIGLVPYLPLVLLLLVVFGYLGAISSLLQFTIVQSNTPDEALGRVNSLWAAQDVVGESFGAVMVGALAKWLTPLTAFTLLKLVGFITAFTFTAKYRLLLAFFFIVTALLTQETAAARRHRLVLHAFVAAFGHAE